MRALYSYLASGENQLTFHENDRIALVGERAKGWQFGENLRTQLFGWFPVAYTENEADEQSQWNSNGHSSNGHSSNGHSSSGPMQQQNHGHHPRDHTPDSSLDSTLIEEDEDETSIPSKSTSYQEDNSPTRMFGDTIMYRQSKPYRRTHNTNGNMPKPGPPPTLPAPVPAYGPISKNQISQSHSFSSNGGPPIVENRKSMPSTLNYSKQVNNTVEPNISEFVDHPVVSILNNLVFRNEAKTKEWCNKCFVA